MLWSPYEIIGTRGRQPRLTGFAFWVVDADPTLHAVRRCAPHSVWVGLLPVARRWRAWDGMAGNKAAYKVIQLARSVAGFRTEPPQFSHIGS